MCQSKPFCRQYGYSCWFDLTCWFDSYGMRDDLISNHGFALPISARNILVCRHKQTMQLIQTCVVTELSSVLVLALRYCKVHVCIIVYSVCIPIYRLANMSVFPMRLENVFWGQLFLLATQPPCHWIYHRCHFICHGDDDAIAQCIHQAPALSSVSTREAIVGRRSLRWPAGACNSGWRFWRISFSSWADATAWRPWTRWNASTPKPKCGIPCPQSRLTDTVSVSDALVVWSRMIYFRITIMQADCLYQW